MKSLDISIVIVNYNTNKLVYDCISSIKKNTKKVKYEIIIIDNTSTEPIKETKDAIFIFNKENLGFARANNQGIKISKGKYVLLLNSDTLVKFGAIDKLYEFAEEHTDAGVVVPQLLNTDGTVQASAFKSPTVLGAIQQYFFGKKNLVGKYIPKTQTIDVAVMAAFLITPQALQKVGKLNENYFMYYEDFDYCRSVRKVGLKIYYLEDIQIIHIHGASHGKNKYLVDSAKKYHGFVGYYIYTFILWFGQKWENVFK